LFYRMTLCFLLQIDRLLLSMFYLWFAAVLKLENVIYCWHSPIVIINMYHIFISTILGTNGLNSSDVPLSKNKQKFVLYII